MTPFNHMKKILLSSVVALPLLACGAKSAPEAESSSASIAADTATSSSVTADPAFYKISDEDTTIYVLGTIHVLPEDYEWFDGELRGAFERSDELVIEMVAPDPAVMGGIVQKLAIDPNGKKLSSYFDAEMKSKYEAYLAALNIPANAFEVFEPWMASVTLTAMQMQTMGLSSEAGVETILTAAAQTSGKKISGLETAIEQLGFFDNLSKEAQLAMLESGLESLEENEKTINEMIADWAAGDINGLAALMNEAMEDQPELVTVLLTDRNERWAEWVKTRLDAPGTIFMAVGAGHIAGEGSLFDVLDDDGIDAVRLEH